MGLFDSIKKKLSSIVDEEDREQNVVTGQAPPRRTISNLKSSKYYQPVKKYKFHKISTIKLKREILSTWDSFFSMAKTNPTIIGFDRRSRKKFKHLYHDETILIAEAAGVMEIVTKKEIKQITLKDSPLEKLTAGVSNQIGTLYIKNEQVAFVNHQENNAMLFEFKWQPFRFSIGADFWLVGTRETYNGPGELYCFDLNGNVKWAIEFKEIIPSLFGEISFMPYLLEVSTDSTDIFVASMDRLYRLDIEGNLKARIAISELKEKELREKQEKTKRSLTRTPRTEQETISQLAEQLASEFSAGFERMAHSSPFAGFAHDPITDMVFVLEEQGRLSAWDEEGKMVWLNIFKNEGRFISWIDEKVVVSFKTGETFWMTRDGQVVYGAKLPNQVRTIGLIPNQEKYLIVNEDNRLYELHKSTGELVTGSEGHPGMALFTVSGQMIFFDGGLSTQGYFWLSPEGHLWKHYEAKTIADGSSVEAGTGGLAPEIAAIKNFPKKYSVKTEKGEFGNRVIDLVGERIYVAHRTERMENMDDRYFSLSDEERKLENKRHNLVCMDFQSNVLWKKEFYSSMWSLFISPDGNYIFTSIPEDTEITYLPGHLLILTKDGEEAGRIKVSAHGFNLEFTTKETANIQLAAESAGELVRGILRANYNKKWEFIEQKNGSNSSEFGAGLYKEKTTNFKLKRTDKKRYILATKDKEVELKLSAAVYEIYEVKNRRIVLRTGTRVVSMYNESLEKVMEVKETENITSVVVSNNGFAVVTKKEVKGYNFEGKIMWNYSALPKSYESTVVWNPNSQQYVWVVSNNLETVIATVAENGVIAHSQSFNKSLYHHQPIVSVEKGWFVVQTNDVIEAYKMG
ncbi:ornithine cyclodeaminase [Psychrobacillus sp. NPDC093180]|uniref:ornithine cyclodeaminase n=1 Tax=Psychrobacillus sp. NPDC093180 TaxID=3364489 RepID=UPI00380870F0